MTPVLLTSDDKVPSHFTIKATSFVTVKDHGIQLDLPITRATIKSVMCSLWFVTMGPRKSYPLH